MEHFVPGESYKSVHPALQSGADISTQSLAVDMLPPKVLCPQESRPYC